MELCIVMCSAVKVKTCAKNCALTLLEDVDIIQAELQTLKGTRNTCTKTPQKLLYFDSQRVNTCVQLKINQLTLERHPLIYFSLSIKIAPE